MKYASLRQLSCLIQFKVTTNVISIRIIIKLYQQGNEVHVFREVRRSTYRATDVNLHETPSRFGYYSLWLVVYKARVDTVLPAC